MALILLVEDDPDQRLLRRMILERAGHAVNAAASPAEALAALQLGRPACVLMDFRLPQPADGLALIREIRELHPDLPIVVLSGQPQDLDSAPEAAAVSATLAKPVRTENLLKTLARFAASACVALLTVLPLPAQSREFSFDVPARSEVIAELRLASPGADWAVAGREAATATLTLDGAASQQVIVFGGPAERAYGVFLGSLEPGPHKLRVERDARLSASGAGLAIGPAQFESLRPGDARLQPVAHAPILLLREDTAGRFSDVPLLAYYTRGRDAAGPYIEYTVIFSNEDGGTSTRDLMARWGRATDIEYIYRVWLDERGRPAQTLIQTREHKDVPYEGRREGTHPVLVPVTDNNMVEPAQPGPAAMRFQLVPLPADIESGSREAVMDLNPVTYLVSAKELEREAKLRPPAVFDGEKITDPRLYLVVEMKVSSEKAAAQVVVRRRDSRRWQGSALGLGKNFIERSGWVRTALELPPGTRLSDLAEIGVECLSRRDLERQPVAKNGRCRVEAFGKVFFLGRDYVPQAPMALPALPPGGWSLKAGEMEAFVLP